MALIRSEFRTWWRSSCADTTILRGSFQTRLRSAVVFSARSFQIVPTKREDLDEVNEAYKSLSTIRESAKAHGNSPGKGSRKAVSKQDVWLLRCGVNEIPRTPKINELRFEAWPTLAECQLLCCHRVVKSMTARNCRVMTLVPQMRPMPMS